MDATDAVASGQTWRLHHHGELAAEIEVRSREWPWVYGILRAQPVFEPIRPLFAAWDDANDADDVEAMERIEADIRAALTLSRPDGHQVAEFLLSLDGDEAGFRWLDE